MPATWTAESYNSSTNHPGLYSKFLSFADSQSERKAMWFFVALIVQGVFFLPLPAFLMYYYDAPLIVLLITMTCFFTTIISYMGGAGIRTVLLLSASSILIQVLMAALVII